MTEFRDTKSVTERSCRHRVCRVCGAPIEQPLVGRPRAYCSDVCRQRASRRRRRVKPYHLRQSDGWCTPDWLLDAVLSAADRENGYFDLDPCSPAPDGPVPALKRYTIVQDGLAQDWRGLVWCNPPYSRVRQWIAKCAQAARSGAVAIALVPARTDTRWWHQNVAGQATVLLLPGRLKFERLDGRPANAATFPSALAVYGGVSLAHRLARKLDAQLIPALP